MASLAALLPEPVEGAVSRRRAEGVDAVSAEVMLTLCFQTYPLALFSSTKLKRGPRAIVIMGRLS